MLEKAKTKNRIDNFQTNQKYKNAFLKSKKEKKAKKKVWLRKEGVMKAYHTKTVG